MGERRNLYYVCTNRLIPDRLLAENVTNPEAHKVMNEFMRERNYKPYYIRSWEDPEGCRHYDVGSYTEFFEWRNT